MSARAWVKKYLLHVHYYNSAVAFYDVGDYQESWWYLLLAEEALY